MGEGVHLRCSALRLDRYEQRHDEQVYRLFRGPTARVARAPKDLPLFKPLRLDGADLSAGKDELLREASRRVSKGRRDGLNWRYGRECARLQLRGRFLSSIAINFC